MKHRTIQEQCLKLVAGAVLLGLGTGSSLAQQQRPGQQQEPQPGIGQQQDQPGIGQQQDQPGIGQQQQERDVQTAAGAQQGAAQLDQLAEQHENISTFIEAVKAAGMEDSLTSGTEYTLFAPTNEAFEQMSGMTTEELLRPENRQQLISILRAHIVADDVDQEMARTLPQAQTIDGGTVELESTNGELRVGDARVVEPDIQAGNLRVHAVDQVLSQGTQVALAPEDQTGAQDEERETQQDPFEAGQERQQDPSDTGQEDQGQDDPFREQDRERPGL